ncbi:MAG: deoxyribonuclease IV [Planctomycetota bacterium]|nr:deoxyribonuclease IV [Planctomycetota bacterium]
MYRAILEAVRLGFQTVQVFTGNPRQLSCSQGQLFTKNQQQRESPPLTLDAVFQWQSECRRARFEKTASHASYLINLASPDEALWRRSIDAYGEELRRCSLLGIPYCVIHPGCHMGGGEQFGISRVAAALDEVHSNVPAGSVLTCLESTAGQGSSIGHRLEHLAEIIERVGSPNRVGVCLDTAHLFAAGYDFREHKYSRFVADLQRILGRSRVKVLHLNDSKKPLGSRVDRHEHIGHGLIGLTGFRPFVRDSIWSDMPKILETPKEKAPDGRDWDEVNRESLTSLM